MTLPAPSWQEVTDCLPTDRYQAARVQPKATLAEHLEEFAELWEWITSQWQMELSDLEQENFWASCNRDRMRPLQNPEELRTICVPQKVEDFLVPLKHVADCLGLSFQYVSKLRQHFVNRSIIVQTEPAVTNRSPARFR